jgi:hypothetical protein
MEGDLIASCFYGIDDLFDNYVIAKSKVLRLNSNNKGGTQHSNENGKLSNVLRLGNTNVYEIEVDNSKKLLVRLRTGTLAELCRMNKYIVYHSSRKLPAHDLHNLQIIDLGRLCNILGKEQYRLGSGAKQHIDITNYVISVDIRTLTVSHLLDETYEGFLHKYKINFDSRDGSIYLFSSVTSYELAKKAFCVRIPIYKYKPVYYKTKWINILTLGPYTHNSPNIPTNEILPFVISDLVKSGYNVLLYPDLLVNLIEERNAKDKTFLSRDGVKFVFDNSYIRITDVIHNRHVVFSDDVYEGDKIDTSRIIQEDKVVVCLDHINDKRMAYKPFVLSEMELVKPMPCCT